MPAADRILIATSNPHKVEEIARVFADTAWRIVGLEDLGVTVDEPVEDAPTFAGNARIKARHYAAATGSLCLADDSGLAVDALGGAPGVYSARYAGVAGPRAEVDAANNRKLVEQLRGVAEVDRTARFVCAMVLSDPRMTWAEVRGTVEGRIVDDPRGDNGFGYDPHFFVPTLGCTTAELSPERKNAISHRGAASRRMLEALRRLTA